MAASRRADVTWEGDLQSGRGRVTAATTGVFKDQAITWASRTGEPEGRTSPEELLAAAHASCYAMALSSNLAKRGTPPERLEISATVTFDQGAVQSSALEVRGKVPGSSAEAFREAAEQAKDGCPISKALKGNVNLSVKAELG